MKMLKSQGNHRKLCLDRSEETKNNLNLRHSNLYKKEQK